jgi:tRNA-modifying protein YgfZ
MADTALHHYLRLRLTGADRVPWLNGQVTQDVRKVARGAGLWTCICNFKGKLEGVFTVCATEEALWIVAEPDLAETLPLRLEKYLITEDVAIEDVSTLFHVRHTKQAPASTSQSFAVSRFGSAGWDVWQTEAPSTTADGEQQRIAQGWPAWGKELNGDCLVAETGLEPVTVDFHKGCYTGQEVVSRMKTGGKTNRRLTHFHTASAALSAALPATLTDATGQTVGALTSVALPYALGYLSKAAYDATTVYLASEPLQVLPCPKPLSIS